MKNKKIKILFLILFIFILGFLLSFLFQGIKGSSDSQESYSIEDYRISLTDGLYVNHTLGDFDGDSKEDYAVLYVNSTTYQIHHVSPQSATIAVFKQGGKVLGSVKNIGVNYGISSGAIAPIYLSESDKKPYLSFIFGQGAHGYGLNIYSFNDGKFVELLCQFKDKVSQCAFEGDGDYPSLYQVIGDFDKDGNVEVIDWYRDWPYYKKYGVVRYSASRVWRWDKDKFKQILGDEYNKIKQEVETWINLYP